MANILHSSDSSEWFTPVKYVDAARQVMGRITLDPASTERANARVMADLFYDKESNGLCHPWIGNVFLNPPYGRSGKDSSCKAWIDKLLSEYSRGNVSQAILLVNAVPDRSWFRPLWDHTLCFCEQRIRFERPDGSPGDSPTHGNVFAYLGKAVDRFHRVFGKYGPVIGNRMVLRVYGEINPSSTANVHGMM